MSRYVNSDDRSLDYEFVDVLRALSQQNRDNVISRLWLVRELDFYTYNDDFEGNRFQFLFPELGLNGREEQILVNGERLLERSALIHYLESGLFLRVTDTQNEVKVDTEYRLYRGPSHFQATNIDLEIRRDEAPIEVVTEDESIIAHLKYAFAKTEVEP